MPNEYINKVSACNEMKRFAGYLDDDMIYRLQIALNRIPAADVEPVRHGRWTDENPASFWDPRMRCSACGHVDIPLAKWRFCPMCGAKIDEESPKGEDDGVD